MSLSKQFTFGVITDEIDQDFARACRIAKEEGMSYVELHNLWGKAVHELSNDELDQAKEIVDQYGLQTHLVCGMFFRPFSLADVELESMEEHPRFQEHITRLERFIEIAHKFSAPHIRTFGFTRDVGGTNPSPRSPDGGGITDETLAKIAKGMQIACDRLASEGLTLALENARSLYANTGGNMRRVLDAVARPNLKIIWDPANAFVAGEDPADGFQQVRGHIVDVHCKDAKVLDDTSGLTGWARIGDGGTDWATQLRLLEDEPVTAFTIETHWKVEGQDRAENTRQTFEGLKEIVGRL
ncbi:sugar phosphate isomerase/epimerase [Chloroflexi bacterium TSY]|nr:sugar phosphate isomerase/epimerase [Chloroflexi bacterium TSY]